MRQHSRNNRHKSHEAGRLLVKNFYNYGPNWPNNCYNTRAEISGEHATFLFNVPSSSQIADALSEANVAMLNNTALHQEKQARENTAQSATATSTAPAAPMERKTAGSNWILWLLGGCTAAGGLGLILHKSLRG